jgi:hypothetical protein
MTRLFALVVALASVLAACASSAPQAVAPSSHGAASNACRRAASACGPSPPMYDREVLPVLAAHCFKCHAGEGAAADEHDFSKVATLQAQRLALTNEIGACAMPPSSEPPLGAEDANILLTWAACGAR